MVKFSRIVYIFYNEPESFIRKGGINKRGKSRLVQSGEMFLWSVEYVVGSSSVEAWLVKEILETTQTAFVRVQKRPWGSDLVTGRGSE